MVSFLGMKTACHTTSAHHLVEVFPTFIKLGSFGPLNPVATRLLRPLASRAGAHSLLSDDVESAPLASFRFANGDVVEFDGVAAKGELSWHISTQDGDSVRAFFSAGESPLKLYVAAAPRDEPIPWLIPAVDQSPGRMQLITGRRLVDRLPERGTTLPGGLSIDPPSAAGGPDWLPDLPKAIGGYCGPNGEDDFATHWCLPEWDPEGGPLTASIYKCTAQLSDSFTHHSIDDGGTWRRRRFVEAIAAACTDPVRIRHQYRELGFFQWNWPTASDKILGPGFTGSAWLGIVRRRRRVRYDRQPGGLPIGGVRAWTKFEW